MNKEDIKSFLIDNRGYRKWGKRKLAKKFNSKPETIREVLKEIKYETIEKKQLERGFKRLFFDIETSPNLGWFWRATYKTAITPQQILEERRIITVSWKWEGEEKVYHLNWDKNKCDKALLVEFTKVLLEADEVIAHNGDRFDIPWLRTRCLMHGLPFPTYIKSLDTLKKVKSMFNFQSNTLNYIAGVLGLGTKKPTGGSKLWTDLTFMYYPGQAEYKEAMDIMHEYCDFDVVLLEDVYHKIQAYIKPVVHVGVLKGNGRYSCPNCGSDHVKYTGHTVTATGTIRRQMECSDCGSDYIISNRIFKNFVLK